MKIERIIDCHCHVASTRYVPDAFLEGIARTMQRRLEASGQPASLEKIVEFFRSQYQDHHADQLVKEMNQAGVDQAVLLLPDFTYAMKCELSIEEMIGEHFAIKKRHESRFYLFYGVDPRWGKDGLNVFERSVERYGLDGMKIYPPCGYSPSDPRLYPYYEICQARKAPVLLHSGPTTSTMRHDFSEPMLIDEAAQRFPNVNFILAHGAVNYTDRVATICNYRHNVYLDTAGFLGILHPQGYAAHLSSLFSLGLNHKVLFGTDWPVFRAQGGQKLAVERFCAASGPLASLSPRDANNIMSANIRFLLGADGVLQRT